MATTKLSIDTETMSDEVREINAILLAHPELIEDAMVMAMALLAKQKEDQGERYELTENDLRFMNVFCNVPEKLKKILKEKELWGPYIRAIEG